MQSSKETRILNTICVVLVLLAGPIRLIGHRYENFPHNNFICILYSAAAFIWIFQVRKRVIQREERRYLACIGLLIVFWILLRTVKYEYLTDGNFMTRFAWYLYYAPLVFGVVLMFLAVLHIGRPYNRPISKRWKLIYIPSAVIVAGILTNDLHQLAFRFPNGVNGWDGVDYTYGPFYFVAVFWIAIVFLAILVVAFARCSVPGKRRMIWMPLLPLSIGALYCILSWTLDVNYLFMMYTMPELFCFVFAAFLEGLMLAHLIPTNDSYEDFWNLSTIGAGIMDWDGEIRYKSISGAEVTKKQIQDAQKEAVLLENGNMILKSNKIHGGFSYWIRDISEIHRLNRELSDLGDVLSEENAMLDAENQMKEKRMRIEQQNRIYEDIAKQVSPQLDRLAEILSHLPKEEEDFEKEMKYACVLNTYVKRHSNLMLLSHQNPLIGSGELQLAMAESLEYVRLCGIHAYGSFQGEECLPGEWILLVYKVFEAVLETVIPGVQAVLVNVDTTEKSIVLRMELDSPKVSLPSNFMREEIQALQGRLEMERERNTEYISFSLRTGGERD